MATFYAAYEIDPATRQMLIETFMPKYPEVVAHHITYKYGADASDVPPPPEKARVVGYHDSGAIQVLVVDVDGNRHQAAREDGARKLLHITFALDRAQGVSPSKSNAFLEKIVAENGFDALCNLPEPIDIQVTPKLILDPPEPHEAQAAARQLIAQKTDGPNGVIAYALVNDLRVRADGMTEPFYNPDSPLTPELAYAFFETDRVGVPVISAPGGTQDIHVSHKATGQKFTIEFSKVKSLHAALGHINVPVPDDMDTTALEQFTLEQLILQGFDVEIETPLAAAYREAHEEQGIDLTQEGLTIGDPVQFTQKVLSKRTLDALADSTHSHVLSLDGINTLSDIAHRLTNIRTMGTFAPTPVSQRLFAVQVNSFATTQLAHSGVKTENKIPGRLGKTFMERGIFASLGDMRKSLDIALLRAKDEDLVGDIKAAQEIFATHERLRIFAGIEATLVKELRAKGVNVRTDVPLHHAITPDVTAPVIAANEDHGQNPVTPQGNGPKASGVRSGRK